MFQELTRPGREVEEVEALLSGVLDTTLAELCRDSKTDDLIDDSSLPPLSATLLAAVKRRRTNQRFVCC